MNSKLPYYMAYPMPLQYDDEKIERRDYEYMKSLYPDMAKKILPYIEDECDRMAFNGSMVYDEYPDKLQLRMMCSRIFDAVNRSERMFWEDDMQDEEVYMEDQAMGQRKRPKPPQENWVRNLIEVMLYQELYKRRCDDRRCRRKFY